MPATRTRVGWRDKLSILTRIRCQHQTTTDTPSRPPAREPIGSVRPACTPTALRRGNEAGRTRYMWSGRRGSNPRPTAWKAVTLPLSYSRLRSLRELRRGKPATCTASPPPARQAGHLRGKPAILTASPPVLPASCAANPPFQPGGLVCALHSCTTNSRQPVNRSPPGLPSRSPPLGDEPRRTKAGGEGRIRTFEGAWPTDLQSAAFDRSATSPHTARAWAR